MTLTSTTTRGTRPGRDRHLHASLGPLVVRPERRTVGVSLLLAALVVVAGVGQVLIGDYTRSVQESLAALFGLGEDRLATLFVQGMRLPRAIAAVVVGAALGIAGAVFQSLTGNPLASPDVIGFTTGAATGALVAIIVVGGTPDQIAAGALAGGLVVAAVVYALAYRGRGVASHRLVLVGVGVGAILLALNSLLLVRASLGTAQAAAQWLAGSLNAMTWDRLAPTALAVAVLVPLTLMTSRSMAMLMMGDELSTGAGVRPRRLRTTAIVLGVALVSVATATTGPVAFVALVAPQLARRLTRSAGVGMTAAALMGGLLVLAGDLLAQRLFAPTQLPVGVVTGSLGGLYLVWLLGSRWRRT